MQKVGKRKEGPQAPCKGEETSEYPDACGAELCEEEMALTWDLAGAGLGRYSCTQLHCQSLGRV